MRRGFSSGLCVFGFNTTLVQLKDTSATESCSTIMMFQYHSGPIKRTRWGHTPRARAPFQYHSGPIKRYSFPAPSPVLTSCFNTTLVQLKDVCEVYRLESGQYGFNTTLVQLKVYDESSAVADILKFQYHSGPIKSRARSSA